MGATTRSLSLVASKIIEQVSKATFGYAPVFVAKEKGFFKRKGLYPEIIIISRNEQIVQALISDSSIPLLLINSPRCREIPELPREI